MEAGAVSGRTGVQPGGARSSPARMAPVRRAFLGLPQARMTSRVQPLPRQASWNIPDQRTGLSALPQSTFRPLFHPGPHGPGPWDSLRCELAPAEQTTRGMRVGCGLRGKPAQMGRAGAVTLQSEGNLPRFRARRVLRHLPNARGIPPKPFRVPTVDGIRKPPGIRTRSSDLRE